MCFSAGASFTAAVGLSLIGILSLRQVRNRALYPLAAVPLLFAVQQFAEGMVWVTHGENTWWVYLYLLFALLVWPLVIPGALWMMEQNKGRAKILIWCLAGGIFVSLSFAYELFAHGASAAIMDHHIYYDMVRPFHSTLFVTSVLYTVPTIGAFFVSSNRLIHILGALVFGAEIITAFVWELWSTSVWCFFAALVSSGVLFVVRRYKRLA